MTAVFVDCFPDIVVPQALMIICKDNSKSSRVKTLNPGVLIPTLKDGVIEKQNFQGIPTPY